MAHLEGLGGRVGVAAQLVSVRLVIQQGGHQASQLLGGVQALEHAARLHHCPRQQASVLFLSVELQHLVQGVLINVGQHVCCCDLLWLSAEHCSVMKDELCHFTDTNTHVYLIVI